MSSTEPLSDRQKDRSVDRRLRSDVAPIRAALVISAVIGTLASAAVIAQALLLADILSWAVHPTERSTPTGAISWLLVAFIARALLVLLGEALASRSAHRATDALRTRLLEAAVAEGPVASSSRRTGALVLSATRGLRSLDGYISRYIPAAMTAAVAPIIALVALAIVDWPSALVALGLVVLVPVLMIRLGRRAAGAAEREWSRLSSLSTRALELIRGLPTLRALGRVDQGRVEMTAASESVAESIDATLSASLSSGAGLEFVAGVGVGLVAMLAGLRLLDGGLSLSTAIAAILVAPEVFLPLRRAGAEFHASTEGRAAASTIYELLDDEDRAGRTSPGTTIGTTATPLIAEDVSLSYPGAAIGVLTGIRFELTATAKLVVTGPSGSGKTTLLSLLAGFLAPSSGRITAGGVPLGDADASWWSSMVALVPQEPHVFAATLRHNLSLGGTQTDADIHAALRSVGLAHLAEDGDQGLDLLLLEGGRSISAGERQRLGLARALLLDRPVVLLDEATSHLDQETVARLRSELGPWLAERCVVEVGHRPALLGDEAERIDLADEAQP